MRRLKIEQKGLTFDHDFGYPFPLFSSLLKNREEEKENKVAKIVIKSHVFLLDQIKWCSKLGKFYIFTTCPYYQMSHYLIFYSRRKYYCYHQNTKKKLLPIKNGIFSNIAKAILDFSLLLPIYLSLFQLCDSKSCRS